MYKREVEFDRVPLAWRIVLQAIEVGKAGIGGAGLGIAALASFYGFMALTAGGVPDELNQPRYLDLAALFGGLGLASVQIVILLRRQWH